MGPYYLDNIVDECMKKMVPNIQKQRVRANTVANEPACELYRI